MALLPKEPSNPKDKLSDYIIMLWGVPKSGKTTLASQFPGAMFLATEKGHNALSVFKVDVDCWETFLEGCKELAAGAHEFKTIVIDTLDNLWQLCRQYMLTKLGIEHESDMPYGRAYAMVQSEFERVITKLSLLPYGLVLISHADVQELQTRTGTQHKLVPSLKDRPRKFLLGMADMILFVDIEEEKDADGNLTLRRVIRTQPHPTYEAGDRTGRLPAAITLEYASLVQGFEGSRAKNGKTKSQASKN